MKTLMRLLVFMARHPTAALLIAWAVKLGKYPFGEMITRLISDEPVDIVAQMFGRLAGFVINCLAVAYLIGVYT